eukprot:jgi/Ulvmu1/7118/UM034_0024.1
MVLLGAACTAGQTLSAGGSGVPLITVSAVLRLVVHGTQRAREQAACQRAYSALLHRWRGAAQQAVCSREFRFHCMDNCAGSGEEPRGDAESASHMIICERGVVE